MRRAISKGGGGKNREEWEEGDNMLFYHLRRASGGIMEEEGGQNEREEELDTLVREEEDNTTKDYAKEAVTSKEDVTKDYNHTPARGSFRFMSKRYFSSQRKIETNDKMFLFKEDLKAPENPESVFNISENHIKDHDITSHANDDIISQVNDDGLNGSRLTLDEEQSSIGRSYFKNQNNNNNTIDSVDANAKANNNNN